MQKIIPNHIAIIPDGNRRWSKKHGKTKEEGYEIGIRHIGDVLKWCKEYDIKILTMWGFSIENFNRDQKEVGTLFNLFKKNLQKALESDEKNKYDLKIRFLGRLHLLPKEIQQMMKKAEEITAKNTKYQLNLLISYGGRAEIVDAINAIIKKGYREVNEEIVSQHMYTAGIPDPDLIIRTSGEQRLSGLLPWQSVYSEFYFCKKLWPDFSKKDFEAALREYAKRKRRFGR